jgi:hypothetical protein
VIQIMEKHVPVIKENLVWLWKHGEGEHTVRLEIICQRLFGCHITHLDKSIPESEWKSQADGLSQ